MELSKAENVCEFLEKVVEHYQKKRIILILDNCRIELNLRQSLRDSTSLLTADR